MTKKNKQKLNSGVIRLLNRFVATFYLLLIIFLFLLCVRGFNELVVGASMEVIIFYSFVLIVVMFKIIGWLFDLINVIIDGEWKQ